MGWSQKKSNRFKTVIEPFCLHSKRHAVQKGRQLWTLCGQHSSLDDGSEIVQAINEGLITQDQYHAAEISEPIYKEASQVILNKYPQAHIIHGNLVRVMDNYLRRGRLAPELVYVDTLTEPPASLRLLAEIMSIINCTSGYSFVACNMQVYNTRRKYKYTTEEINKCFINNKALNFQINRGGWKILALNEDDGKLVIGGEKVWALYKNKGNKTGIKNRGNRSTMMTVIYTRQGKALCSG